MKSVALYIFGTACLALAASLGLAAEPIRHGTIEIRDPWARASIGTSRPAAAYLTIQNLGTRAERLVDIKSPVAERTEVHATTMTDGVMRMQPAGEIDIAPGDILRFSPGGHHIMLMKLNSALKNGHTTNLVLTFKHAGDVSIEMPILGPGASGPKQ